MPREPWFLTDERRDAAVQAAVTEYYTFEPSSLNAHAYALAAFCDEIARQKSDCGECDGAWATLSILARRLRSP